MNDMFIFTRPEADFNGKIMPEMRMMVSLKNLVEVNETTDRNTGDTAVWLKVWSADINAVKSIKVKESWSELIELNK